MALIIVSFILIVLKVNIVWTTSFLLDVHEMMTPEELSQTFGIYNGSVPDYQVLSMVLPGTNRRRQGDDQIFLRVEVHDRQIDLYLTLTAGYLASRYTPVWSVITDQRAFKKIRYDPLPNAMKDIGQFKMYQDVNNGAAIVVYADPKDGVLVEGILSSGYVLRSLPRRLMDQAPNIGNNNVTEMALLQKRSNEPDADEVTTYCVLFKSPLLSRNAERNVSRPIENRKRHSQSRRRRMPQAVYPEILLILDYNARRNHTITQALRFMLAFWNGVDMVYSSLVNPKVHLNIAGIIISADDAATPYIAKNTSIKMKAQAGNIVPNLGMYFRKEQVRFPSRQFDIIFAMTTIELCREEAHSCSHELGFASLGNACTPENQNNQNETIGGVGVVHYDWMFGGINTAVHQSSHLFGVDHDEGEGVTADCHERNGSDTFSYQSLKLSPCSKNDLRDYFMSSQSLCLHNTPMWIKPVRKVLPGRWLTLDGQCRNSGFRKMCHVPDNPVCLIKGCRPKNSTVCVETNLIPLPGTKCGENQYCELDTTCVDE